MSNPVVAANAEQASKAAFTPTYFPGVTDPDSAKSFRVDIGREVRADFRLVQQEAARVFGFAFNATNGRPVAATIGLAPVEDVNVNQYNGTSTAGSFAIDRVVPGSYIVSARSTSGERLAAFTRIRVLSAKQFFLDLRLPMSPGLQIVGNLGLGSEVIPDISRARISLTAVETGFPSPIEVAPNARGQFSFSDVLPGEYLLSVSGLPDDMYVRAAMYDTTDALESGVTVRNQISSPLQLQLGADGGRIAVAVFNRDNKQLPDVSVVLVPDSSRRHRPDQYRIAVTGSEGQATFRGIPPGNYKIFAWEQIEPNAYLNSEFVRAYEDLGVGVTVKPGENAAVGVRVIPRDE
jgi:hypothetical protein